MQKQIFKNPLLLEIAKPAIVLLAICIIIPLALSVTNAITVDRIAELNKQNAEQTMSHLLVADEFTEETYEDITFHKGVKEDAIVGYVFTTFAKGYGGALSVMTAVSPEGKVLEIAILDATNETPGLGQNVTKENFYLQFKDKTSGINVIKGGSKGDENSVKAVTGATISSKAVASAVNEALEQYAKITSKEGQVESNEGI